MSTEVKERVKELAAKIVVEWHPEKFLELLTELNKVLQDLHKPGRNPGN